MTLTFAHSYWCRGPLDTALAQDEIVKAIQSDAVALNVATGPIDWDYIDIGDEGCPPVPDWMPEGASPRLLVGRATPIGRLKPKPSTAGASFLAGLSHKELTELRKVTKRVAKTNGQTLTDAEADAMIMKLGPKSAEQALRAAIDGELT